MSNKEKIDKEVIKELLGYILSKDDKTITKWKGHLCGKRFSQEQQFMYSVLIMQSIEWSGISQETQNLLCDRAKIIISDYLKFKILSELIDEVFHTPLTNQSSQYDFSENTIENEQFVVEILINSVLSNTYDAITRAMLLRICQQLHISYDTFSCYEHKLLNCLCVVISSLSKENESLNKNAKTVNNKKKWIKIAATGVLTGALCAIAAPVLLPAAATLVQGVASVTALIGGTSAITAALVAGLTATASFLSTSAGLTIFTTGMLAGGAGFGGKKMYNRVDNDVDMKIINTAELPQANTSNQQNQEEMKVVEAYDILLINGLLQKDQTLLRAWGFHPLEWWFPSTFPGGQVYLLDWESELLAKITTLFFDGVVQTAYSQFLSKLTKDYLLKGVFVFPAVLLGVAPVNYIDNVWSVAKNKASVAGIVLANEVIKRESYRSLSIVAYSVGCCAVLSLLDELVKQQKVGILEDVILLGCPASANVKKWSEYRQVISGRFVNGYSKNDGMLYYFHRIESGEISVAGLMEVAAPGVENVDLSSLVKSHFDYNTNIKDILCALQFNRS